jgi:hypothetical protein
VDHVPPPCQAAQGRETQPESAGFGKRHDLLEHCSLQPAGFRVFSDIKPATIMYSSIITKYLFTTFNLNKTLNKPRHCGYKDKR